MAKNRTEQGPTYASQENANDLVVLVSFLTIGPRGKRESLAQVGFNCGRGRGSEISELVGGADDKRAEGAGRHFDEVDTGAQVRASIIYLRLMGRLTERRPRLPARRTARKRRQR